MDAALAVLRASVNPLRDFNVGARRECGQQVELLENESDLLAADFSTLTVAHAADVLAFYKDLAIARHSHRSQHVHEGGLAATGRTHDRRQFARAYTQVHAAQRLHIDPADSVRLPQINRFKQYIHRVNTTSAKISCTI